MTIALFAAQNFGWVLLSYQRLTTLLISGGSALGYGST